jgi:alpha-D-ribose 1-methylphosphonate 5-triphosphate diphosphatase
VSANVADLLNMDDRGRIEVGKRADLIRVRPTDGVPVIRTVWREGGRVS